MLKLSAEDIANQSFEKCFRGYSPEQVEEFLEVVAREWEHLRSALEQARQEVEEKQEKLEEYREREKSLQESLEMAKRVSDEIKEKAEREAELKIADAEVEAERILAGVEDDVASLQEDIHALRQQRNRYEAEFRSLLSSHQEMLDRMSGKDQPSGIPRAPSSASPDEREDVAEPVTDEDIESSEDIEDESEGDEEGEEMEDSAPRIRDSVH
jgi:cell division initiation protein